MNNPDLEEVDFTPEEIALIRPRLQVILFTIFLNIIAVIIFTFLPWSDWRTGMALNLVDNAILIAFALIRRDGMMGRLLLYGLIVGFVELIADAWIVDYTGTLDYALGGGPMIWRSPLWMPFAWEVVAIQFAVLGGWLIDKYGSKGLYLAGLIGAINIPFYEELALKTHWWAYSGCAMLLHTPYFIILGEFFIAMVFAVCCRFVDTKRWSETIGAGFMGGIFILLCYAFAFSLIEAAGL